MAADAQLCYVSGKRDVFFLCCIACTNISRMRVTQYLTLRQQVMTQTSLRIAFSNSRVCALPGPSWWQGTVDFAYCKQVGWDVLRVREGLVKNERAALSLRRAGDMIAQGSRLDLRVGQQKEET